MSRSIGRWARVSVVTVGVVALVGVVPAVSVSAAGPTTCRVRNVETGVKKASLAAAVRAASARQHLTVQGTCHGTTRIAKRLTITGIRRDGSGIPTLDGDGVARVLRVDATVTITGLTITDGSAAAGGAGILNTGDLTLHTVVVRDNAGTSVDAHGAGVLNRGILRLTGTTSIRDNTTAGLGGGVFSDTGAAVIMAGTSSIRGNESANGGGVMSYGSLTMNGRSAIADNDSTSNGGGVYLGGSTVVMNDRSSIRGNETASYGGGVFNDGGIVRMRDDSSIHHNTATVAGGGYQHNGGSHPGLECGVNVHDNTPEDCVL